MNVFGLWDGFYNDPWFWQFPMATLAISMAAMAVEKCAQRAPSNPQYLRNQR